jgi:hypothetical protein
VARAYQRHDGHRRGVAAARRADSGSLLILAAPADPRCGQIEPIQPPGAIASGEPARRGGFVSAPPASAQAPRLPCGTAAGRGAGQAIRPTRWRIGQRQNQAASTSNVHIGRAPASLEPR